MRIINLFNKYFLILVLVQGFFLIFIDNKKLKKANMGNTARKAKRIGVISVVLSIILYIASIYSM